ncbi:MAG TPA: phosphoribosyltransferase family protein [Mycobacteriales bacterium]|nr:phosphoribosyltransferase family protein [Mycobacteriales bacterium]
METYADRDAAGGRLGAALSAVCAPLVLGLPRGGVVVAARVARLTGGQLGVVLVRKLGAPSNPEYAIGALAEDDPPLWDASAVRDLGLTPGALDRVLERERLELERRRALYRGRPLPPVSGREVVVVDDGLASATADEEVLELLGRRAGGPGA